MNTLMIFSDFLFVGLNIGLGVLLAAMFVASNVYLPMIEKGGGLMMSLFLKMKMKMKMKMLKKFMKKNMMRNTRNWKKVS